MTEQTDKKAMFRRLRASQMCHSLQTEGSVEIERKVLILSSPKISKSLQGDDRQEALDRLTNGS